MGKRQGKKRKVFRPTTGENLITVGCLEHEKNIRRNEAGSRQNFIYRGGRRSLEENTTGNE